MIDISANAQEIPLDNRVFQEKNDMPLYIDSLNYFSFIYIIIFLAITEFGYILVSLTSSDLIVVDIKDFFFDISQKAQDIRMAIQNLTPQNFFLTIIFQFIHKKKVKTSISFNMNLNVRYIRNNTIFSNVSISKIFLCKFYNDKFSYKNHLVHEKISNFDSMVLVNQFSINSQDLNGIRFEWMYVNPESWSLLTQTLNSFMFISLYFLFCYFILYHQKITVNFFLLLTAFLSTNPFRLIIKDQDNFFRSMSQTFFSLSIFISFERLFLLSLFFKNWNFLKFFLAIIFFALYSYSESLSRISKFAFEANFIKQKYNRLFSMTFHIVFSCLSIAIFITKMKSPSFIQNKMRLTFYFILTSFSIIVTITTQVVFVLCKINEKSVVPLYSYVSAHFLIAYVLVFLHRPISMQKMIENKFHINSVQYK